MCMLTYAYMYMCVCVCVCVYNIYRFLRSTSPNCSIFLKTKRERGAVAETLSSSALGVAYIGTQSAHSFNELIHA